MAKNEETEIEVEEESSSILDNLYDIAHDLFQMPPRISRMP